MAEERLPAHLEVTGLIRAVEAAGGFGTVIEKGERDAGTLLVICCEKGTNCRLYERMPQPDGLRNWQCSRLEDVDNKTEFADYWRRRKAQDPDLWVLELDVVNAERFIGIPGTKD